MNVDGSNGAPQTNAPEAELDLYLEKPNLLVPPGEKFDILAWWAAHANRFPSLSQLAKALLMIPMTSVASESAFSTGGRVIDEQRSRLSDETVEALICTQDWIRARKIAKKIKAKGNN
ncbi:hypothetical protein MJO28_010504 [Puccinia striiformis f. sp. tritici]|uniref:Uncharacterized protein n=1 Tax=Puccinia striiformis f. sp. tritici TaxID=168172 RepID=A0ACC0E6S6_9BASI|nr:hypothetical protein MJO28_010504 [Puccinia striiformis f. sp. tritici]